MGCNGNCGSCSGCGNSLELTEGEVYVLDQLSQFAFLPICRKQEDTIPLYTQDDRYTREEFSLILQLLEQKRLVDLDYSQPIAQPEPGYPVAGSVALTQRGQLVAEQLQISGIWEA